MAQSQRQKKPYPATVQQCINTHPRLPRCPGKVRYAEGEEEAVCDVCGFDHYR